MKKLLIATAALAMVAGTAQAQSSVSVYGILSQGYSDVDTKFTAGGQSVTVATNNTGTQGAQSGSRLGFRGTEDLGGGMKAGFTYELSANTDTGLGANRLGFLDLSGSFGTVRAGKVDSLTRTIYNTYTAHGNSGFAPGNLGASSSSFVAQAIAIEKLSADGLTGAELSSAVTKGCSALTPSRELPTTDATNCAQDSANFGHGGTRVANSIGYISPSMSGFTVQAQYGKSVADTDATVGEAANEAMNFGVSYNAGKLSVMLARDTTEVSAETSSSVVGGKQYEVTTDMLGASYDFGVAKAFAVYMDKDVEFTGEQKTTIKDTTVGVSIPVSPKVVLVASYSDGEVKDSAKTNLDAMQLQANYLFSKRTKAYVMYGESEAKQDDVKYKTDGFVVGVQHSF
jgi:predicted porin